jgi:hypothetical protein
MKLVLFYLTSNSRHYTFPHFIKLLNQSKKKDEWELLVLTHSGDQQFYANELNNTSIKTTIVNVPPHNNYMTKVKVAIDFAEKNNSLYLMKCDNDIFLNPQTLDYMIDNLSVLDGKEYLTLGPTLSSGIPGVEYFMKQYLSDSEQDKLKKIFLKSQFYDRDGVDYNHLNQHTIGSESWNKDKFFNSVKLMPHPIKGIHPIRINYESIDYLNNCILNNKEKFFNTQPTSLILNDLSPYLCDSIFCIRTDTYKKIIYDNSLFIDAFDEIPLNKYAWSKSMKHVFVENGFALHMLYNWYDNVFNYEHKFTTILFNI